MASKRLERRKDKFKFTATYVEADQYSMMTRLAYSKIHEKDSIYRSFLSRKFLRESCRRISSINQESNVRFPSQSTAHANLTGNNEYNLLDGQN